MPSDPHVVGALAALARPQEAFHSAVAAAAEEVRGFLGASRAPEQTAVALGAFAAGRIDAGRFAGFVERSRPVDAPSRAALEAALSTLSAVASARPADTGVVRVSPGGCLREAVADALAGLGRAFGAARAAALVRQNRWAEAQGAGLMGCLAPYRWTRRERRVAPPLVVEVDGSDLHAGALAEFLDGAQKLVVVVHGACAPAPLVRLVTPGTYVLQTAGLEGLDAFAGFPGPGVAAIVPETCARFVHDPRTGSRPWERLVVTHLPAGEPRDAVGGISPAQQAEEQRWLAALAERPAVLPLPAGLLPGATPSADADATDPAGRLAAWLVVASGLEKAG